MPLDPNDPDEPVAKPDRDPLDPLLERARAGDEAAREQLFAHFLPILKRWAHRRLPVYARDLSETDDLVQMTLLRALRRLDQFESRREGAFLAYLRTILINALRQEIRRVTNRGIPQELTEAIADPSDPIPERLDGRLLMEQYEAALARLSEERRTAVILRVEFGYSHAQVAEATGAPSTDAARMTVTRGLQELRAALREPEAP